MNGSDSPGSDRSLLAVSDLSCERAGRALFSHLSFSIRSGETLRIDGRNGSGKSTLLRCLCGFYKDWDGRIDWQISGHPLYVGHKAGVSSDLSVTQNVTYLLALHNVNASADQVSDVLAAAELYEHRYRPVRELSEGQRKKVNLCRLAIVAADLWLLDEPFASLDAASGGWLADMMTDHCEQGGAVIYTSHQPVDLPRQSVLALSDFTADPPMADAQRMPS